MSSRFLVLAISSLLVSPTARAEQPGRGKKAFEVERPMKRVELVTFRSETLEKEKRFGVILPKGYSSRRGDWPVLFLLHGRGRHERSLIDDEKSRNALRQAPFVTILPDGDDGWYIDSPVRKRDRYATYLDEVIRVATTLYRLSPERHGRALAGWSMGGYGCIRTAIRRPGDFAAVVPMIGLLDFPRTGLPESRSYPIPTGRFGSDAAVWRRLNPIRRAKRLRGMSILLITADEAFDRTMNENFHERLQALEIPHRWHVLRGGHTFAVVRRALPFVVRHVEQAIADPASRSSKQPSTRPARE